MNPALSNDEILEQLKALEKDHPTHRVFNHCMVVRLSLEGYTQREIAKIVDCNPSTVNQILKRFHEQGIEGLVPIKQQGRPHFLSSDKEKHIVQIIIEKQPRDVLEDCVDCNWTAPLVMVLIKTLYGVKFSEEGIYHFLHRNHLSWTCPSYVLAKADPEKQEQFKENFQDVKKN